MESIKQLKKHFASIGSKLIVQQPTGGLGGFRLDVVQRPQGSAFLMEADLWGIRDFRVTDARPKERHLLLRVQGSRFLCGHDERHWFVAAVPERPVSRLVSEAFEALKPEIVIEAQEAVGLSKAERMSRHNAAFIRQGEWFFVPRPGLGLDGEPILGNEPISRGNGSKPHRVEQLVRFGGIPVYVSKISPGGFTLDEMNAWCRKNPRRRVAWQEMRRGATAYARGRISHPDHETIRLDGWHEVVMNRENEAPSMRHVAFLD